LLILFGGAAYRLLEVPIMPLEIALINGPVYLARGAPTGATLLLFAATVLVAYWLMLREARTLVAALPIALLSKVDLSYCYYVNCTLIYY
jgi:hypothetical protein